MNTQKQKYTNLSNHKVHRYVFSKSEILKDMLEGILPLIHEDIKIKNIKVGAELLVSPCIFAGKESYSDVVAVINDSIIVLIELYNKFELEQEIKSIVYGCKIYGNQIIAGKKYKTKKRVIILNLINNSTYDEPNIINEYDLRHYKKLRLYEKYFYDKHIRVVNILLDKLAKSKYTNSELKNKGLKWLNLYLVNSYEKALKIGKGNKIMSEAVEMVRAFLNDPIVRGAMTNEEIEHEQELEDTKELALKEGIEKGLKQGIEQGMEKGIVQNKLEIAKNMFDLNLPINVISIATGLSEQEINSLL